MHAYIPVTHNARQQPTIYPPLNRFNVLRFSLLFKSAFVVVKFFLICFFLWIYFIRLFFSFITIIFRNKLFFRCGFPYIAVKLGEIVQIQCLCGEKKKTRRNHFLLTQIPTFSAFIRKKKLLIFSTVVSTRFSITMKMIDNALVFTASAHGTRAYHWGIFFLHSF